MKKAVSGVAKYNGQSVKEDLSLSKKVNIFIPAVLEFRNQKKKRLLSDRQRIC